MLDGGQNNAMAETALALAMGFFSIMVLTMVSMGGGEAIGLSAQKPDRNQITIKSSKTSVNSIQTKTISKTSLIIYFEGAFYDAHLQKLDIRSYKPKGQIVLAVQSSLPLARAIKIQKLIPTAKITITTLDNRWLKAFKELKQ